MQDSVSVISVSLEAVVEEAKERERERRKQIKELKKEMNKSIEDGDFEKGEKIKAKIDKLQGESVSTKVDAAIQVFKEKLEEENQICQERVQKAEIKKYMFELDLREQLREEFLDMARAHVTRLTKLETEMCENYKNVTKPDKRVIAMFKEAVSLAKKNQFKEAQKLRDEAEEKRIEIEEKSLQELSNYYENAIEESLNNMNKEMEKFLCIEEPSQEQASDDKQSETKSRKSKQNSDQNNSERGDFITKQIEAENHIQKQKDTNRKNFDRFVKNYLKKINQILTQAEQNDATLKINAIYQQFLEKGIIDDPPKEKSKDTVSSKGDSDSSRKSSEKHFINKSLGMKFQSRASKRAEDNKARTAASGNSSQISD